MPDNTLSTLAQIKTKVRRLTRSLSTAQLSDSDLNSYINTAVLYDFPEHIRLANLKTNFTFYTQPFVDTYSNITDPSMSTNPMYNFLNTYITVNPPVYIGGYQALWVQSESQFYGIYPKIASISTIGSSGDGSTTTFSGNINTNLDNTNVSGPTSLILAGSVLFDSMNVAGQGISLIDYPVASSNVVGALGPVGTPVNSLPSPYGQINYVTGDFSLNFTDAPAAGAPINSQVFITQPSIPQTVLFYDGSFILRPVPDQVYKVEMEAYIRPTELLNNTDQPLLSEWWQYISYLTSLKVFQDRMDLESAQMIMPELKKQENLIKRRTIVQLANQRSNTIYNEHLGAGGAYGSGWFSGGGQF